MNSIAIACKHEKNPDSDNKKLEKSNDDLNLDKVSTNSSSKAMELHINLWKMRSGWSQIPIRYFIDFGIMTTFINNGIRIYVPFKLRKKDKWVNLGETICNDNRLLCAVFNEDIKAVPNQKNKCFFEISSNSYLPEGTVNFEPFLFYSLNKDSFKIEDDKETEGCWIKIRIPTETLQDEVQEDIVNQYKKVYIRFRLRIKDVTTIAFRSGISNDLIQAAFSKLDMYDIRVNDHRNLGKYIKEKIQKEEYMYPVFSKAHVFYISNPKTSVRNGSITMCDSRIIEPDIWGRYQPSKFYDKSQIAHHWKFKNDVLPEDIDKEQDKAFDNEDKINDFCPLAKKIIEKEKRNNHPLYSLNLFFTAKYPKIEFWTLLAYFSIIVLLGAVGSWLADFMPDGKDSVIGWDWNLKTYIIIGLGILIVLHWLIKHVRLITKIRFRFD